ncbi:unnamed protein product [Meganyctiphanes norvegica]|uniref:XK-related protein n=1 Tax=Meganyctiphanes norvegica TaxID=48144 RepID=A0AAV2S3Z3_MEGNR
MSTAAAPPECQGPGCYIRLWLHAERDAATLDLLCALMQDAPMLMLQLYILATDEGTIEEAARHGMTVLVLMQIASVSTSILMMAWSVASWVRSSHLAYPSLGPLSLFAMALLTISHFASIAGQVVSLSLFAAKFLEAAFTLVLFHWGIMSLWLLMKLMEQPSTICTRAFQPHDSHSGMFHWLDDIVYSIAMGLVFLFTYVDVSSTVTQAQRLCYRFILIAEEATLLTIWFLQTDRSAWYHYFPLCLVPVLLIIYLVFDKLYCIYGPDTKCLALKQITEMNVL